MTAETTRIPFREGLWTAGPSGEPRLLGSRCDHCGEVFFPRRAQGFCLRCQAEALRDTALGPHGTVVSFTTVMQPPAGGFYQGPTPYNYGLVDVDDGVRVEAHILGDPGQLGVGTRVRLAVERLFTREDGAEVDFFCFAPAPPESGKGGTA